MMLRSANFVADFTRLRGLVDDSPDTLRARWQEDAELQRLCDRIAMFLRLCARAEEESLLTAPVDQQAILLRNECEREWADLIAHIANRHLHELLDAMMADLRPDQMRQMTGDTIADKIADQKEFAEHQVKMLDCIVDYVADQLEWKPELSDLEAGLDAWKAINENLSLNLTDAIWRRRCTPHLRVPQHVARHYGAKEASLYRRFEEAARAWWFGAPLACLAMQRATYEEVTGRFWGSSKTQDLAADNALQSRADRLKNLANAALHLKRDRKTEKIIGSGFRKEFSEDMDRTIIENFLVLKQLIEEAPKVDEVPQSD